MNRRRFCSASLPMLLGWAAPSALAQDSPTPRSLPRRVKIEVSHTKFSSKTGDTNAQTLTVVTNEGVEAYASFVQTDPYRAYQAGGDTYTTISQTFGPSLRVTPHIGASGDITLNAEIQFDYASGPGAAPDMAVPITSNSLTVWQAVKSGHAVTLSGMAGDGVREQIQLAATILAPQEKA